MSRLDWIILAFALILAAFGFRQGFIVGVLSFAGFVLGAFLGTRLAPLVLPQGSASPYAPAFGLGGALLLGGLFASGMEGLGFRLRRAVILPGVGALDGVLGAALGAALALGIVWIAAAVVAQAPVAGSLRADIQGSAILRRLNALLPPTGPILNALARLDRLPSISGPAPDVAPPLRRIAGALAVKRASHSVVRVIGTACGLAIEGSGWVAGPEEVVTNAHVVAGEGDTAVQLAGKAPTMPARVLVFDPTDDVAVLAVRGLQAPALGLLANPPTGLAGAIVGYPENGPLDAEAARIGRTQRVLTQDAYGRGPVERLLTPLRGRVRAGNSGGPVVDSTGRVLTTVFAGTVGGGPRGGYGIANSTVTAALGTAGGRARAGLAVSTQSCGTG